MSVTAGGFTAGTPSPTTTVTLTPQGGGAAINTPSVVTGNGIGRSINFLAPSAPAGLYNVTATRRRTFFSELTHANSDGAARFHTESSFRTPRRNRSSHDNRFRYDVPSGLTTANFGTGISVGGAAAGANGPVVVQPNGTAIATLNIAAGAALGGRSVTVSGSDTITQANAFTVTSSGIRTLTLIAIDPATGPINTPVSITASGFAVGIAAPPFTVTLTPQGGGAVITTNAVVTGTALGRSINFVVPPGSAAGPYNVTAARDGLCQRKLVPLHDHGPPSFTLNPASGGCRARTRFKS